MQHKWAAKSDEIGRLAIQHRFSKLKYTFVLNLKLQSCSSPNVHIRREELNRSFSRSCFLLAVRKQLQDSLPKSLELQPVLCTAAVKIEKLQLG